MIVEDTELDGQRQDNSVDGIALIGDGSYRLRRVNAHGSSEIARANWGGVEIVDSWLHDPYCTRSSCLRQGIQTSDGDCNLATEGVKVNATESYCIRLARNRIENSYEQHSNILLKADQGQIHDVLVEGNLFNGGQFSFWWSDGIFTSTKGTVRNNRWMRAPTGGYWPMGGSQGPVAIEARTKPVWVNNAWYDNGGTIPLP